MIGLDWKLFTAVLTDQGHIHVFNPLIHPIRAFHDSLGVTPHERICPTGKNNDDENVFIKKQQCFIVLYLILRKPKCHYTIFG